MKTIKKFVNQNSKTIKKVLIGAGTVAIISFMLAFGMRRYAIEKYHLEEIIAE